MLPMARDCRPAGASGKEACGVLAPQRAYQRGFVPLKNPTTEQSGARAGWARYPARERRSRPLLARRRSKPDAILLHSISRGAVRDGAFRHHRSMLRRQAKQGEEQRHKTVWIWIGALGLTVIVGTAQAEPLVLSDRQLESVTAGSALARTIVRATISGVRASAREVMAKARAAPDRATPAPATTAPSTAATTTPAPSIPATTTAALQRGDRNTGAFNDLGNTGTNNGDDNTRAFNGNLGPSTATTTATYNAGDNVGSFNGNNNGNFNRRT
jgi:hypothetical protein